MAFEAFELSQLVIRSLRAPVATLAKRDRNLARQIRDAASSVPANLQEGDGRQGADRQYHFTVAYGSARELGGHLASAVSWGYVEPRDLAPALTLLDRLRAVTFRLANPR